MQKIKNIGDYIIEKLSRVTSGKALIPEIDGLRFFAIGTVLLYHLTTTLKRANKSLDPDWLSSIIAKGGLGVDVFFAISGFILAMPFAYHYLQGARKVDIKSYFVRRLTRLEPPFILVLIIFYILHIVIDNQSPTKLFPNLLASFFYVHSIVYNKWSVINPVTWSLEVEVQFYILAPLLALLYTIKNSITRRTVIVALIIGVSFCSIFFKSYLVDWHLRKSILVYLHIFLAGFLFADIFVSYRQYISEQKQWWADILGFAGIWLIYNTRSFNDSFLQICFVLGICFLFFAAFKGKLFNTFFANRWIAVIGGMCYTLYLLHYPIIIYAMKFTRHFSIGDSLGGNILIQALFILPLVFLVSSFYFIWIEKPCMYKDWPSRLKTKLFGAKTS
jgi:peptidoglycan/LPS O-acetylase OafA/YrhL